MQDEELEEAPRAEALVEFAMDPEMMKWNDFSVTEIKIALTLERAMKMMP